MSQQTALSPLTFKVARLWSSPEGTTEKFAIDKAVTFHPEEIDATTNLVADLMLVKLKEEISALVTDATITVRFTCQRCLKPFSDEIHIPSCEREFLAQKPGNIGDVNDLFLIDAKAFTIDLHEMMRQEIILHFPFIPVCSKSCKGLCQHCGKDRNTRPCSCKDQENTTQKPFKDLKKLMDLQ